MSRLARIARGVMETAWLLALIVAPLYFNVQTDRVFEPDKILLVRWLALIAGVAWVVWAVETGWRLRRPDESWKEALQRLLRIPLVAPTLLIVITYAISTLLSVTPYISFFGSYQRLQGTWTTYSYILFFTLALQQLRTREQLERLVTVVVITSVPISLYGILQHYGVDPLPWGGDVQRRIAGHMGNAIFIAAYLIMVSFLTLYRVIRSFVGILSDKAEGYRDAILGGLYLFIFAVQVIALVFSISRGPGLGWAVGMYIFVLLFFVAFRPRYYRVLAGAWVGLAVLGMAFLIVFNLPQTPLEPLREMPYVGRFGKILDVSRKNPTGRVRVLIWQGVVELIAPHEPLNFPPDMHPDPFNGIRPLVGYGPESMWVAYNRFYQPELAQIEKRNASPDRSHNETFDSLVRTGVLGFVAYLWLFVSIFYFVLRWLGLITSRRDTWFFLGSWFGFGAGAALMARVLDGSWRFFGVALPSGFIVGLIVYVTLAGLTRHWKPIDPPNRERYLLLLALLGTITAHYMEVNFGIAIVSTRTYFWILAALLVSIGTGRLSLAPQPVPAPQVTPPTSGRKRRKKRTSRNAPRHPLPESPWNATFWLYALLLAFIFATLAYEFIINMPVGTYLTDRAGEILTNSLFTRIYRSQRVSNPQLFFMLLFVWVVSALVLTGEVLRDQAHRTWEAWLKGFGVYTGAAWGGFFIMALWQAHWHARAARLQVQASRYPEVILQLADHMASFPVAYYLLLFLTALLGGIVLGWTRDPAVRWVSRAGSWGLALVGGVFLLYMGFGPCLRPVQADIYFKQAKAFERARRYPQAEAIYQRVLKLAPREDYYYLFYGKTLLEHAQAVQDPAERERLLSQAEEILLRAQELNPLNADHTANLGRFYVTRARMTSDPERRRAYLEKAIHYFAQAVALSPNNARLRDEYAIALLQAGREKEALRELHKALEIDDTYYLTYFYLADYFRSRKQWEKAAYYYEEALRRNPKDVSILSGLAYVYAQLGDLDKAIEYNLKVLERKPNDYASLRNLAILYQRKGDLAQALHYARLALRVAPEKERSALEQLIQDLEKTQATP